MERCSHRPALETWGENNVIDHSDSQAIQQLDTRPRRSRRRVARPSLSQADRFDVVAAWRTLLRVQDRLPVTVATRLFSLVFGVSTGSLYRFSSALVKKGLDGLADGRRFNGRRPRKEHGAGSEKALTSV